jgi:hypothetical protein
MGRAYYFSRMAVSPADLSDPTGTHRMNRVVGDQVLALLPVR